MRNRYIAALGAVLLAASTSAPAVKPKAVSSPAKLPTDMGVVRLSIQSQTQHGGKLYVWFLREGGSPENKQDILRFDRGQGVPIAGTNMIDQTPRTFALPPGRYRLLGHGVGCGQLPPEGTMCLYGPFGGSPMPTGRYGPDAPTFEVVAGQLTDAGEFILESPQGTPMGEDTAMDFAMANPMAFQMRVRPSRMPMPAEFRSMPSGPAISVDAGFQSMIRCVARPKGAMMYLPWEC